MMTTSSTTGVDEAKKQRYAGRASQSRKTCIYQKGARGRPMAKLESFVVGAYFLRQFCFVDHPSAGFLLTKHGHAK
jgi:hypothetical protein